MDEKLKEHIEDIGMEKWVEKMNSLYDRQDRIIPNYNKVFHEDTPVLFNELITVNRQMEEILQDIYSNYYNLSFFAVEPLRIILDKRLEVINKLHQSLRDIERMHMMNRVENALRLQNKLNRFIGIYLLNDVEDEREDTESILFRVLEKYVELNQPKSMAKKGV